MLERATHSLVTFSGHSKPLDRWLQHRQLLVSGYCYMITNTLSAALPPLSEIKYWCEELVDYLTAGHFQVFSELLENASLAEGDDAGYSHIVQTTNELLSLQESVFKLEKDQHQDREQLLSTLGEYLAKRLEYEDSFISKALKPQPA